MPAPWAPESWRAKPILQVPEYPDRAALEDVDRIATFRRWCSPGRRGPQGGARRGRAGEAFLLQGGDCAESFAEHRANNIRDIFRVFLQMAVVLTYAAAAQVVKVGRIAGQFAKPRSSPTEKKDGQELPSYRGDIINGPEFTAEARTPDANRQLQAYRQSAATLNLIRAILEGGYAEPRERASLGAGLREGHAGRTATRSSPTASRRGALHAACGITSESTPEVRTTSFYTSHEALLLGFEQALTRRDEAGARALVCHLGPHAVDRRPHPPARSCARGVCARHQQSARPEMRAVAGHRRRCCG